MTPEERQIVAALTKCRLGITNACRFISQLDARTSTSPLSDRQRAYLWAIAWSWRRQLSTANVELARRMSGEIGLRLNHVNTLTNEVRKHGKVLTADELQKTVALGAEVPHNSHRPVLSDNNPPNRQDGIQGDDLRQAVLPLFFSEAG